MTLSVDSIANAFLDSLARGGVQPEQIRLILGRTASLFARREDELAAIANRPRGGAA